MRLVWWIDDAEMERGEQAQNEPRTSAESCKNI